MSIQVNGSTYYWTAEACRLAGTSKNTFLRWVKEGRLPDTERRDRRGWRLFAEEEVQGLKSEVNRIDFNNGDAARKGSHQRARKRI